MGRGREKGGEEQRREGRVGQRRGEPGREPKVEPRGEPGRRTRHACRSCVFLAIRSFLELKSIWRVKARGLAKQARAHASHTPLRTRAHINTHAHAVVDALTNTWKRCQHAHACQQMSPEQCLTDIHAHLHNSPNSGKIFVYHSGTHAYAHVFAFAYSPSLPPAAPPLHRTSPAGS